MRHSETTVPKPSAYGPSGRRRGPLSRRIGRAMSIPVTAALMAFAAASPAASNEPAVNNADALDGAQAVLLCNSRSAIIADLKDGYAEQPTALGVTSAGTVMELWTAPGGNTWTLVVTMTNGDSCIVGAGDGWTDIQKEAKGEVL